LSASKPVPFLELGIPAGIGIATAVAVFLYSLWVKKYEAPDI
jgi:hypothetical protein